MLGTTGIPHSARLIVFSVLEDVSECAPPGVSGQSRFRGMLSCSRYWPLPTGLGWDVGKAKIRRHFRLRADFGFLADMP
jgi:hypothetical protein